MISSGAATGPSSERPNYHDLKLPIATRRWIGGIEAAHPGVRFSIQPTWPTGKTEALTGRAKRERDFLAGRRCAAQLLSERSVYRPVGVNKDRSPAWPEGIVGSISHSERWTVACIASEGVTRSIGVDTEPVVSSDTRKLIACDIATEAEFDRIQCLDLNPESALTLVFSAKEAFYKCLYPISKRFLEFLDVEVVAVTESTLRVRQTSDSSAEVSAVTIEYQLSDDDVFTFAILEGDQ